MTGWDGTHQDWLEGQASDRVEREALARERTRGLLYEFEWSGDHLVVHVTGLGQMWFTAAEAVTFANSILAEVQFRNADGCPNDD